MPKRKSTHIGHLACVVVSPPPKGKGVQNVTVLTDQPQPCCPALSKQHSILYCVKT